MDDVIDIKIFDRHTRKVPAQQNDRLVLLGERDWIVEGLKPQIEEIAKALGSLSEKLSDTVLLIDFGNAVGRFNIPYLGMVEVVSGKWSQDHLNRCLKM